MRPAVHHLPPASPRIPAGFAFDPAALAVLSQARQAMLQDARLSLVEALRRASGERPAIAPAAVKPPPAAPVMTAPPAAQPGQKVRVPVRLVRTEERFMSVRPAGH